MPIQANINGIVSQNNEQCYLTMFDFTEKQISRN
jgi:hypothetical protein